MLGLELAVPPMSLMVVAWTVLVLICAIWWQWGFGSLAPLAALIGIALLSGLAILLAWTKYGRRVLPLPTLLIAPVYVVWKVPIYLKLLAAREKKWVRTERNGLHSGERV
jgi:hypothetical protein